MWNEKTGNEIDLAPKCKESGSSDIKWCYEGKGGDLWMKLFHKSLEAFALDVINTFQFVFRFFSSYSMSKNWTFSCHVSLFLYSVADCKSHRQPYDIWKSRWKPRFNVSSPFYIVGKAFNTRLDHNQCYLIQWKRQIIYSSFQGSGFCAQYMKWFIHHTESLNHIAWISSLLQFRTMIKFTSYVVTNNNAESWTFFRSNVYMYAIL